MGHDPVGPLAKLGASPYILLTTFRRDGTPVATAVWVARDDEALVVTTLAGTGKVKRLKHDPRVTVQPCDRRGTPVEGTPVVQAKAYVITDDELEYRTAKLLKKKYGWQFALATSVDVVRRAPEARRVALRIVDKPWDVPAS